METTFTQSKQLKISLNHEHLGGFPGLSRTFRGVFHDIPFPGPCMACGSTSFYNTVNETSVAHWIGTNTVQTVKVLHLT